MTDLWNLSKLQTTQKNLFFSLGVKTSGVTILIFRLFWQLEILRYNSYYKLNTDPYKAEITWTSYPVDINNVFTFKKKLGSRVNEVWEIFNILSFDQLSPLDL